MDIPSDEENDSDKKNNTTSKDLPSPTDDQQGGYVDTSNDPKAGARLKGAEKKQTYKLHQRNPLFSGAENSCLWELNRLSRHYHPSVSLFASTLMKVSVIPFLLSAILLNETQQSAISRAKNRVMRRVMSIELRVADDVGAFLY